ncbi:MAG: hypothetical protein QME74_04285 [Candidatus Edwardsbacteria bacterium]|nr:hypothetical protein [Candidatus Edwardsbacteria bacterium]
MGNTISSNFSLLRRYVEHEGGERSWHSVWSQMEAGEQHEFNRISKAAWGHYPLFFRLIELGAAATGVGGAEFARRFAAYQVQHDIPLLVQTAIKFGKPGLLLLEAGQIWKRYNDSGKLEVYDVLPNSVRTRLTDVDQGGPFLCETLMGFFQRGIELAGRKNVVSKHPSCLYRGDQQCEFYVHWD